MCTLCKVRMLPPCAPDMQVVRRHLKEMGYGFATCLHLHVYIYIYILVYIHMYICFTDGPQTARRLFFSSRAILYMSVYCIYISICILIYTYVHIYTLKEPMVYRIKYVYIIIYIYICKCVCVVHELRLLESIEGKHPFLLPMHHDRFGTFWTRKTIVYLSVATVSGA